MAQKGKYDRKENVKAIGMHAISAGLRKQQNSQKKKELTFPSNPWKTIGNNDFGNPAFAGERHDQNGSLSDSLGSPVKTNDTFGESSFSGYAAALLLVKSIPGRERRTYRFPQNCWETISKQSTPQSGMNLK